LVCTSKGVEEEDDEDDDTSEALVSLRFGRSVGTLDDDDDDVTVSELHEYATARVGRL
jgi:hypothetical protein